MTYNVFGGTLDLAQSNTQAVLKRRQLYECVLIHVKIHILCGWLT